MRRPESLWMVPASLCLFALTGCTTAQLRVSPAQVTSLTVRPVGGGDTFCPGKPLELEVVAKMADGSLCSTTGKERCLGEQLALDPAEITLEGAGERKPAAPTDAKAPAKLVFVPERNALVTADTGLVLRAKLTSNVDGKPQSSPLAEVVLKPEYSCAKETVFAPPPAPFGVKGAPGPNLRVFITTIDTPFVKNALLFKVEDGATKTYVIADGPPPINLISMGGAGGDGRPGANGVAGIKGADGVQRARHGGHGQECLNGTKGGDGQNGGNGQDGGDGGDGGTLEVILDEAKADAILPRLAFGSLGGPGGRGGGGGRGGVPGQGGEPSRNDGGGSSAGEAANCGGQTAGQPGNFGVKGSDGAHGKRGNDGAKPSAHGGKRDEMFKEELPTLQKLEGRPPAK